MGKGNNNIIIDLDDDNNNNSNNNTNNNNNKKKQINIEDLQNKYKYKDSIIIEEDLLNKSRKEKTKEQEKQIKLSNRIKEKPKPKKSINKPREEIIKVIDVDEAMKKYDNYIINDEKLAEIRKDLEKQ
nr:hypothetical protein [Lachnospiraceae bacterium]